MPYDRLVHFSFGLLWVYPFREIGLRLLGVRHAYATLAAVALVFACSAGWAIMECLVAVNADPQAAEAFLVTQGDPWDAQKDMAMACLGSFTAFALIAS